MTATAALPDLSDREYDVLCGMANGYTNGRIGRDMGISEDTVKTHIQRMFRKWGIHDRALAVSIGYRTGVLDVNASVAWRPLTDTHKAACYASRAFGPPPSCRPEFHEAPAVAS